MVKIKMQNSKWWWKCKATGILLSLRWEYKLVQLLRKIILDYSWKPITCLPYLWSSSSKYTQLFLYIHQMYRHVGIRTMCNIVREKLEIISMCINMDKQTVVYSCTGKLRDYESKHYSWAKQCECCIRKYPTQSTTYCKVFYTDFKTRQN